jgi:hypothetical protein
MDGLIAHLSNFAVILVEQNKYNDKAVRNTQNDFEMRYSRT